ncbi:hypothetical protein EON83_20660 [bacterium]|nr:MAG: hypothetical protein EON83_20660 [bacterium]
MKSISNPAIRALGILSAAGLALSANAAPAPSGFLEQVKTHITEWDTDHDDALTIKEVELALSNPKVKGPEAAAVASLRRGMKAKKLASLTLDQITASVPFKADANPAPPNYESMYKAGVTKIETTPHELFPEGQPDISTLAQGRLGDCFLMAALGTYTYRNPAGLKKMMQVQPDGQVALTFATGQKTVMPMPTDGEIIIGSTTRGHGVWGNMFEKSVGQVFLDKQKTGKYVSPYSIIGVGGSPHTVLQMLTGRTTVRVGCEDFRKLGLDAAKRETMLNDLRATLIKAQDEGKYIVCGNGAIKDQARVPGIYFLHSYSVLGYDAKADTVAFWNPMSNAHKPKGEPGLKYGYPTSYGKFTVPLTEVVQWLGSFSIETNTPVPAE